MANLVIYDSQFGNTQKIAEAIAGSLPKARMIRAGEATPEDLKGVELLVVGSPTQGGRPMAATAEFLEKIPDEGLAGVKAAAFDTRFREADVSVPLKMLMKTIGYAAPKIAKRLEDKGAEMIRPPEGFIVTGKEGPLALGELDRAKKWLI